MTKHSQELNTQDLKPNRAGPLVKLAVIGGVGIAALTGCAPGSEPAPTQTSSASPEVDKPKSLTCVEYGASLEIPTVDSPEGQAYIQEHMIPADTPPEEVQSKLADFYIDWIGEGVSYIPEDRKTLEDCGYNYDDHIALDSALNLNRISDLRRAALTSVSSPEIDTAIAAFDDIMDQYTYLEVGARVSFPKGDFNTSAEVDPNARTYDQYLISPTDVKVAFNTQIQASMGGVEDMRAGGHMQINTANNRWEFVGKAE